MFVCRFQSEIGEYWAEEERRVPFSLLDSETNVVQQSAHRLFTNTWNLHVGVTINKNLHVGARVIEIPNVHLYLYVCSLSRPTSLDTL